ncbi:metallophosphoesterase [Candidatus Woesearchaeota archaeon]|nr:metallophosphoesterase [Candidatus Woesearchaeota archaeon]
MELAEGLFAEGLCIYSKVCNILAFSDAHIGYEESLNRQGILLPRQHVQAVMEMLEKTLRQIKKDFKVKKFSKIIINGDLKHEFGRISEQEWRHTLRLLDFLRRFTEEIVLVKGNHDTILGPIAEKRDVKIVSHEAIGGLLFVHGDKIPGKELLKGIKTIIIGHEHPAVSLSDGIRAELFKCFLKGRWKGRSLIVLPSCSLAAEGTDITKEELQSPFLKGSRASYTACIVADKAYPPLKLSEILRRNDGSRPR